MSTRYALREGIIIRRKQLPNGDIVITLISENGKWRAIAKKGKLLGGNLGKLSLFHDVTVQYYRKNDEDLALITQVQLGGALPQLADPAVYPYAHILAELTDKLTVDVHLGENIHSYLASGLRGLAQHSDPEAVALIMSWKLLQQAGLSPRLLRCARCGASETGLMFDIAAGGITCNKCNSGIKLNPKAAAELSAIMHATMHEVLQHPLSERNLHWVLLSRYISFHVTALQSLNNLQRFTLQVI